MQPKKNEEEVYTIPTYQRVVPQRIIEISFWKAVSIVAGAVLVAIVGTAVSIASVLNSDHFLLAHTADKVDELEKTAVRKDVQDETNKRIEQKLDLLLREFNLVYKEE